jgi:hypothetical protein
MKLLIMQFLQPPVTSSFFGPNILLSTLFSNTVSLCSSHNVRDEVSHPHFEEFGGEIQGARRKLETTDEDDPRAVLGRWGGERSRRSHE